MYNLKSLRLHLIVAVILLLAINDTGHAQQTTAPLPRVIVKLRTKFAADVEAALPMHNLVLIRGQAMGTSIQSFMERHTAHRFGPVYPGIVRAKKQRGLTDLQIAAVISHRFPLRARRLRGNFRPPEISRTYILELDDTASADIEKSLSDLRADPDVEYAEADHVVSTNLIPNDPYFLSSGTWGQAYDDLWGIKKIGSPAAWDNSTGAGVIVAVVDTGIDFAHPDITANIWTNTGEIADNGLDDDGNGYVDDVHGWDFIGFTYTNPVQSNNPVDHFGHGTHVAGTIAAVENNGIGVIGVAWNAQIMPVKALDDFGQGLDSTLGPAIIYAANNGADVISNSWAGPGQSQTISDAVSYAHNLGAVIVAAAGNDGRDARIYYPANLSDAITVAATDPNDVLAYFSNYGDKIDVSAPGVDILSLRAAGTSMGTPVDAYYTRASGTSMATPHVSGTAALILSQHPDYSNEDVRQVLRVSATDLGTAGFDFKYGYGRINATAALAVSSVLEAKIISPIDGTSLTGPATISGFARGNNFAQYTLAYGSGTVPSTWTVFASGTTPVGGGALGVFDPTLLGNGLYTIRLISYDTSNNAFVDQIELLNNVIAITSPLPSIVPSTAVVFKIGIVIPITGSAQGANFQDFRLDWAEGINPSSGWNTTGISINGGTSPVLNGPLGTWDTSSITQTDFYTIRLSVDNTGFTNVVTSLVYLDAHLLAPGWPQPLSQVPYYSIGMVPAADGQGNLRLTSVAPAYSDSSAPSQFWSFTATGGSPNTVPLNYGEFLQPAAGSLFGTPSDQVVVADGLDIKVFQPDNSFSTYSTGLPITFQFAQITLQDLNGNSQLETVALGDNFATNTGYLYAWQKDGTQLNANFPIIVPDQNIFLAESRTGTRVLVGDLNGDGNRKIIVQAGPSSSTTSLLLFSHDGTPLTWAAPVFTGFANEMVLADLDHNGKLETLVLVFTGSQEVLHVLQPDGTERQGWPLALATGAFLSWVAVGDITRTGREQIVVSNYNNLYVLNTDGTSFSSAWPLLQVTGALFGPPVLADVDGQGKPEIVLTRLDYITFPGPLNPGSSVVQPAATSASRVAASPQQSAHGTLNVPQVPSQALAQSGSIYYEQLRLVALHPDGSTVNTWNLFGANGFAPANFGAVTVGDFDHSGTTDLAVLYALAPIGGGSESGSVVSVFDTGAPYHSGVNDWPMIFQNPRNTAVRLLDTSPPSVMITYPASGATVGGQITVTANASDNVGVTSLQFQLDGANLGPIVTAAPFSVVWDTTQTSLGSHTLTAIAKDAAGNSTVSAPITVTVTQLATLGVSPSSLSFGGQLLNTTSAPQNVTVTNTGVVSTTISGVSISGDFTQTSNCITTLTPGSTCSISVSYTPTIRGPETGNLTITGNFAGASPIITLSGSGQALLATLSPPAMTFPPQLVGSTGTAQTFTYSNAGDLPVSISGISVTGDFAETSSTCGVSLSAGANCAISLTFTPTARGTRAGTLSITGNINSNATLTGTGQAASVSISPLSLSFGNQTVNTTSAPQNVTITNTGDFAFNISSWGWGGFFTVTSNCPFTINPSASCTFSVAFAPTGWGNYQGTLTFNGSFPGAPANIALSGTGQDTAAILTSTSLSFGNQAVNTTSGTQSTTLVNVANTPISISSIQVTGDFAQTNNCGASVAVGSSCALNVTFHPSAPGARSGSLTINSNTRVVIPPVPLSGTGTAATATFNVSTLSYSAQRVNSASTAQQSTLTNTGNAVLSISSFSISGDFTQTNNCGATLAIGASCSVSITFQPTARGSRTGMLTLNSNASGSAPSIALSGTGVASIAGLTPSSLTFANQIVGTTSGTQSVTLTNSGDATLNISSVSVTGNFSQFNNCGTTLAAGASCTLNIAFTPTATGTRIGMLTIADDALNGSPQTASLTGAGAASIAGLAPSSLTFANQIVGTTSGTQSVTLTNSGNATLNISSISITGNFSQSNNCGATLAAGASCTLNVAFTPTATGTRTGTLTIADNASNGSPQTASLSGTGLDFSLNVSPSSVTVSAGNSARYTATVSALGGAFSSAVSLSCSGLPTKSSYVFSPASITPGSGSANSTMTVTTTGRRGGNGTPAGTYTLTIKGVSGTDQHTTTVRLVVN